MLAMEGRDSGGPTGPVASSRPASSVSTPTPRSRHAEAVQQDPASLAKARAAQPTLPLPASRTAHCELGREQGHPAAGDSAHRQFRSPRRGCAAPPSPPLPTQGGGWHVRPSAAPAQEGQVLAAPRPRRRSVVFADLPIESQLHCPEGSSIGHSGGLSSSPKGYLLKYMIQDSDMRSESVPALDLRKLHTPTPPPSDPPSSVRRAPRRCQSSYNLRPTPRPPSLRVPSPDGDEAVDVAGLIREAEHFSTKKPSRPSSPSMDAATQREREAEKDRQRIRSELAQVSSSVMNRLPSFSIHSNPSSSLFDLPPEDAPSPRTVLNRPGSSELLAGSQQLLRKSKSGLSLVPHLDLRSLNSPRAPEDPPLTSQRSGILPSRSSQTLTPSKSCDHYSALSDALQQEAVTDPKPSLDPKRVSVALSDAQSDGDPATAAAGSASDQPMQHNRSAFHSQLSSHSQSGSMLHTKRPLSARGSGLNFGSQHSSRAASPSAVAPGADLQGSRPLTQDSRRPSRAARESMAAGLPTSPSVSFAYPEEKAHSLLVAGARRRRSWLDGISNSPRGAPSPRATSLAGTPQPADGAQSPCLLPSLSAAPVFTELLEREVSSAQAEKFAAFKRMREENEQLAKYNPSAFSEELAQAEAAKSRELFEDARERLEALGANYSAEEDCKYNSSIQLLQAIRPFYIAPIAAKRQIERRPTLNGTSEKRWKVEDSIFWRRCKENEARSPYDTPEVLDKQFDLDFTRMCTKSRLKRMLAREGCALSDTAGLDATLQQLHAEMRKHASTIHSVFAYFSCLSGNTSTISMLSLRLIEYIRFMQTTCIADPRSQACKPSDVDTIFTATSFADSDEARSTLGGNALCRFEFLEVLVRLSVAKYIVPRICTDVCEAVRELFADCIVPNLGQITQLDPNQFRRDRLYCKEMEVIVLQHWDMLNALYRVYKAPDRSKAFLIEHWIELLEAAQLIGPTRLTGVDKACAKVLFCLSQATVTDELGRRQRAVSLAFFDFVEALARLSEVLAPPPPDELAAWFEVHQQQASARTADTESRASTPRPASSRSQMTRSESGLPALPLTGGGSSSRSSSARRPPARSKSSSLLTRSASGRFSGLMGAPAGGPGAAASECMPIDAWFQECTSNPNLSLRSCCWRSCHGTLELELPWNAELAESREEEGGLGGALHQRAQQLPLSASFGPFMELLASRMQSIWGGRNVAETVARMVQQSQSSFGLRARG